jgi:hypothetical protein
MVGTITRKTKWKAKKIPTRTKEGKKLVLLMGRKIFHPQTF